MINCNCRHDMFCRHCVNILSQSYIYMLQSCHSEKFKVLIVVTGQTRIFDKMAPARFLARQPARQRNILLVSFTNLLSGEGFQTQ